MLTKCVLCVLPRAGKAHKNRRVAFTRMRLNRWLDGERAELSHDRPSYTRPPDKQLSEEGAKANKMRRTINLCGEGAYGAACKNLTKGAPLGFTSSVMRELREKHPSNASPADMHALGPIGNNTAPSLSTDIVEGAIRSFDRLFGAGPSGLRPLHLQEALGPGH